MQRWLPLLSALLMLSAAASAQSVSKEAENMAAAALSRVRTTCEVDGMKASFFITRDVDNTRIVYEYSKSRPATLQKKPTTADTLNHIEFKGLVHENPEAYRIIGEKRRQWSKWEESAEPRLDGDGDLLFEGEGNLVVVMIKENGRWFFSFHGLSHVPLDQLPASPITCAQVRSNALFPAPPKSNLKDLAVPQLITRVEPIYPPLAKSQGVVKFNLVIGADGKVKAAHLVDGPFQLSAAAETAVRQWVYSPRVVNGEAVADTLQVDVEVKP